MAPAVAMVLALAFGCAPAPSDLGPRTTNAAAGSGQAPVADRETWDVLRIGDAKVGYGWNAVHNETDGRSQRIRIQGLNRMTFSRVGQQVELGLQFSSVQDRDGRLVEFDCVLFQGRTPMQSTHGRVDGDTLRIETTTQGKTQSAAIPWSDDFLGPSGSQLALLENPMTPGERRTYRELVPVANVLGTSELVARDYEQVDVLGETQKLLRIDATVAFPDGRTQRSTHWADRSGDVLRTHEEAMNLESLRATKEAALAGLDRAEYDLVLALSVPVERRLDRPHETRRITYRLHLDGGDPARVFAAGGSQQVRSVGPETAEVTVYAVRPDRPGNPHAAANEPTTADTSPNNMIQSDDPEIVEAARQIAAGVVKGDSPHLPERPEGCFAQMGTVPFLPDDAWQLAVALERYVGRKITSTNYSQAFDTALEVFKTGEGDCTEHAVLLAALARAAGIPARVVIGLVYTSETGRAAFGYHMWNELYVNGRWIPMDATLSRGGIGAAHLKLDHTSLEGASALSSFLPVAQVAGRLQIEIAEVE